MRRLSDVTMAATIVAGGILVGLWSTPTGGQTRPPAPRDAVQEAQQPRAVPETRPEQRKSEHDRSSVFYPGAPAPSSPILGTQPDEGRVKGFDFSRDPFGAKKPMQSFEETMREDVAAKPGVMAAQRRLLESRYELRPRLDPTAKMSRGKPLPVGPTARLGGGVSWEQLATMSPDDIEIARQRVQCQKELTLQGLEDQLVVDAEVRELKALLRRAPQPRAEPPLREIRFGDCVFEIERQLLTRSGVPIRLTSTEAALLRALALAAGRPLSRESLSEAPGQSRTVDVQVTRLRRKIEADPKFPRYLQTVRGKGYVLLTD